MPHAIFKALTKIQVLTYFIVMEIKINRWKVYNMKLRIIEVDQRYLKII